MPTMRRLTLSLAVIANVCFVTTSGAFNYPEVRRDDSIEDNYFGTIVSVPKMSPTYSFIFPLRSKTHTVG